MSHRHIPRQGDAHLNGAPPIPTTPNGTSPAVQTAVPNGAGPTTIINKLNTANEQTWLLIGTLFSADLFHPPTTTSRTRSRADGRSRTRSLCLRECSAAQPHLGLWPHSGGRYRTDQGKLSQGSSLSPVRGVYSYVHNRQLTFSNASCRLRRIMAKYGLLSVCSPLIFINSLLIISRSLLPHAGRPAKGLFRLPAGSLPPS